MVFNLLLTCLVISASFSSVSAVARGLAWAADNGYADHFANTPLVKWYYHWQDPIVSQMPSHIEWVPMYWGPQYQNLWDQVESQMYKHQPKNLLCINEPDVSSQANLSPSEAANLYMKYIFPWAKRGTTVCSPAIIWNLNWLAEFLQDVKDRGGYVDRICLHWYGSWNDIEGLKSYIESAHARFNQRIWVTELGITAGSDPSQKQVTDFMMNAIGWMEEQSFMGRVAWFGVFDNTNPPDSYATGLNGLLNSNGELSNLGYWYGYTYKPNRRSLNARHHMLTREDLNDNQNRTVVHCDEICQMRKAQIESWRQLNSTLG
jgi:hypothetical protein